MNVLVTGGCGYLGSQFLRDLPDWIDDDRLTVRILDNLQRGRPEALMSLPESAEFEFIEGDLLDPSIQRAALRDIDAVVHLAAIVRTPLSFDDPRWVEQVNHWGTSHLLEACLEAGVEDFVFASSAAVYGPGGPHAETDTCEPMGAYAHSKHGAERSVRSVGRRGIQTTILRLGTVYGWAPVTRYEAVANRFAFLAGTRRPLTIYGDGSQLRPFIHVRDASDVLCWTLTNRDQTEGETLNAIGGNLSVIDLVEAITDVYPDVETRRTEQDIRTHLSFEVADEKIRSLGWKSMKGIEDGMNGIIERLRGFSTPTHLTGESIETVDV
jgi:UDP-glucose 4-epimerase